MKGVDVKEVHLYGNSAFDTSFLYFLFRYHNAQLTTTCQCTVFDNLSTATLTQACLSSLVQVAFSFACTVLGSILAVIAAISYITGYPTVPSDIRVDTNALRV